MSCGSEGIFWSIPAPNVWFRCSVLTLWSPHPHSGLLICDSPSPLSIPMNSSAMLTHPHGWIIPTCVPNFLLMGRFPLNGSFIPPLLCRAGPGLNPLSAAEWEKLCELVGRHLETEEGKKWKEGGKVPLSDIQRFWRQSQAKTIQIKTFLKAESCWKTFGGVFSLPSSSQLLVIPFSEENYKPKQQEQLLEGWKQSGFMFWQPWTCGKSALAPGPWEV